MKLFTNKKTASEETKESDFSLVSAIAIVILLLTFLSSSIYIMLNSLP